ncbi:MAG: protein kinase [Candidatus Eremiobacteraeota bacterium]|nr:protein kinase [Candidatus Eremiobacteraeota bacterium]
MNESANGDGVSDEGTVLQSEESARLARQASKDAVQGAAFRIPRYELEEKIGQGTFGEVWKATQSSTSQAVAVKIFTRHHSSERLNLGHEIDRLRRITAHPFVLTLLDAETEIDTPFLVMQLLPASLKGFCEGISYKKGEHVKGDFVSRAERWMSQCAEALAYMQNKGMIHCDLKPANILIDENENVRIADFGQAQVSGERSGALGTLGYMPPEQAMQGHPDSSWDIYALGATIYFMLTGTIPYLSRGSLVVLNAFPTIEEKLEKYKNLIFSSPLEPLQKLNPLVDRDLASIVECCLSMDTQKRYGNATQVLRDLQNRKEKRSLSCVKHTPLYLAERFFSRYRLTLSLILLTIVIASLAAVFIFFTTRQADEARQKEDQARREAKVIAVKEKTLREMASNRQASNVYRKGLEQSEKWKIFSAGLPWYAGSLRISPGNRAFGLAVVYSLKDLWEISSFHGVQGEISCMDLNPSGTKAAYGMQDGSVLIIDTLTGKPLLKPLQGTDRQCSADSDSEGVKELLALKMNPDEVIFSSGDIAAVKIYNALRLWDLGSGTPQSPLLVHSGPLTHVEFSSDGSKLLAVNTIAVSLKRKAVHIRRSVDGKLLASLLHPEGDFVNWATFSPDGKRVLTCCSRNARIWDAEKGVELIPPVVHGEGVQVFWGAFDRSGERVLTRAGNSLVVFLEKTGKADLGPLNFESGLTGASFSPDGRSIAVTTIEDRSVRIIDSHSGKEAGAPIVFDQPVQSANFAPDGKSVTVICSDGTVSLFSSDLGRRLTPPLLHSAQVEVSLLLPSETIVSAAKDRTLKTWKRERHLTPPMVIPHKKALQYAVFSPDGTMLLTISTKTGEVRNMGVTCEASPNPPAEARVWDSKSGLPISLTMRHTDAITSAEFSNDGKKVVTSSYDRTAIVWNVRTGKPLCRKMVHDGFVGSASFNSAGTLVVTTCITDYGKFSQRSYARIWDARNGRALSPELACDQRLRTCALFSPDGKKVACGGGTAVFLWDVKDTGGAPAILKHSAEVVGITFSPEGSRILTAGLDGTIRQWDGRTYASIAPSLHHGQRVEKVFFTSDGNHIITCSRKDFKTWDITSGEIIASSEEVDSIRFVDFDPCNSWVMTSVSGKKGSEVRLWDAWTALPMALPMEPHGDIHCVSFSGDGKRFVAASKNEYAALYNIPPEVDLPEKVLSLRSLVSTGVTVDTAGNIQPAGLNKWEESKKQLEEQGGKP